MKSWTRSKSSKFGSNLSNIIKSSLGCQLSKRSVFNKQLCNHFILTSLRMLWNIYQYLPICWKLVFKLKNIEKEKFLTSRKCDHFSWNKIWKRNIILCGFQRTFNLYCVWSVEKKQHLKLHNVYTFWIMTILRGVIYFKENKCLTWHISQVKNTRASFDVKWMVG